LITKFLLQLRILPRWVIIFLDVAIVAFSTFLGYLLRFNFEGNLIQEFNFEVGVLVNSLACLLALLVTKSYAGIVRYTGLKDGLRVLKTLLLTHLLSTAANLIYHYNYDKNLIPFSVILISFLASFVFLFQYRLLIKNVFSYYSSLYSKKVNVAIFGAGQMGLVTKHLLDDDHRSDYSVAAFFEDDANKIGKEINGTGIYSFSKLDEIILKYEIQELVIAVNHLSLERKNEIVDVCLNFSLSVRTVPDLNSWVKGELSISQIKQIKIDDLLERDSINLENQAVAEQILDKCVCITGAAGSIGSELVKQLMAYKPSKMILIDQAESPLYELTRSGDLSSEVILCVADVTDLDRIDAIFSEHKPQLVYHAAAYKHVPLMEDNPYEAINCNILGTKNIADMSLKYCVEKFVMVSTDKAVNPTNVMGASKRIAEMYIQSLSTAKDQTVFITTRFGNVLGSNGSVIPHFKKQIDHGGPITVTHPDITRYFMTISEACELILEAGCMGKGGEIFIFDMGKSVKIVDLAKKMIRLSGLEPYKDVDIVFTGLRHGEKLYEELLADKENTLPTHHSKILVAKVSVPEHEQVLTAISELKSQILKKASDISLVTIMKQIVPEFKSNRSVYEVLD
jgi:FlaA1/EpsC-like NDP-sugar epimerase